MKAPKITALTVQYTVYSDLKKTEVLSQGAHIFTHVKVETAQNKCTAWVRKFRKSLTTPASVKITTA